MSDDKQETKRDREKEIYNQKKQLLKQYESEQDSVTVGSIDDYELDSPEYKRDKKDLNFALGNKIFLGIVIVQSILFLSSIAIYFIQPEELPMLIK